MAIPHTSQRTSKLVVDWACIIGFGSRINRPAVLYRIFALLRWNWSRYFHLFELTSVAVSVFGSVLTSVSFGSVVSVSIERYIALCLHLRYEDIVTVKKSAKLSDNALAYWWNIAFHLCVAHSKIPISFLFHSNTSVSSNFIRGLHQNLSNHSLSPETNHKYWNER